MLKSRFKPVETDPLMPIYGGAPWEPCPPDLAADRFLDELRRLKGSVQPE